MIVRLPVFDDLIADHKDKLGLIVEDHSDVVEEYVNERKGDCCAVCD